MAYKALYRTYRPNSFEEVAGQNHIVKTLQHAVERNMIAHAYLFCGPRGTGKTSIAKIFAKTVNCESNDHKPCLQCESCLAVAEGGHPDIIEIDAASNNGVEEVRFLIEKIKYAPIMSKYKVYIIDEVHMMSTGAFNALLKTIEEPPAHVIFILATTEPHKVLPTIISRCQRFDFTKVPKKEIIHRLHTVLENEHITCEDEVIQTIAQLADGGLRDALSILDQCIAYACDNIQIHHINEIYGITTIKEKLQLFDDIANKNALELLISIGYFIEKGIDIKRLTVDLIELLKDSIIYEYTKDITLLQNMSAEEVQKLSLINLKQRFTMINLLMETYDKYRNAANVGSYFEVCLLQMLDDSYDEAKLEIPLQFNSYKDSPVNKQKIKTHKNIISNVSRETLDIQPDLEIDDTIEQPMPMYDTSTVSLIKELNKEHKEYMNKEIKVLDDSFILGLLAGATKSEKAEDVNNFTRIQEYLADFKWAKSANLLKSAQIVGSGSNYIVVCVSNQAVANEINELDSLNEFHDFILELLNKNKKIFAISKEHQKKIIQEFKECMLNGTLPDPIKVEDVVIHKEETIEKTQEETVVDLFGKENIIITEE